MKTEHLSIALLVGLALAGAATAICSQATAQPTHVTLGAGTTTTSTSGFAGAARTVELSDQEALKYIRWWERRDHPCLIEITGRHVRYDFFPGPQYSGNWCGGRSGDLAKVGFTNVQNQNFISGLRVCTNRDGSRVKGIQVRGRSVSTAGHVGESTTVPEPEDRANCSVWRRWVNCPEGHVATGVVVQLEAGNEPRSIVGMALKCRHVLAS